MGAFNEVGGLHQSGVIQQSLVDHFVPFLPLERSHVKKCVIVEAAKRGRSLNSGNFCELQYLIERDAQKNNNWILYFNVLSYF